MAPPYRFSCQRLRAWRNSAVVVEDRSGIPAGKQRLTFGGKTLVGEQPLGAFGIQSESELLLLLALKGGFKVTSRTPPRSDVGLPADSGMGSQLLSQPSPTAANPRIPFAGVRPPRSTCSPPVTVPSQNGQLARAPPHLTTPRGPARPPTHRNPKPRTDPDRMEHSPGTRDPSSGTPPGPSHEDHNPARLEQALLWD